MASRGLISGNPNFPNRRTSQNTEESHRQQHSPFGRYYGRQSQGKSTPSKGSPSMRSPMSQGSQDGYGEQSRYHGPRLHEEVCVGEEVKIAVNMAVERFINDDNTKEFDFPSSFTATERAYIHRLVQPMGLKSKSKGKGLTRSLTISKSSTAGQAVQSESKFQLVNNSRHQILSLLQRFPLTNKERQELQPRAERAFFSREMNKTTTGRLSNGVSQVPPCPGESDLKGFRETLPISAYQTDIIQAINSNSVVLISGETGSGKTTQVPQFILDDCYRNGKACRIFCTQPRRLAALTVAERVAAERAEKIGQTVGYQIRLESKVSPKTLLTFCTNGVLLRTLMGSDNSLNTVTHVIVDEVHERDRFSDFLLISLRELISKNHHLKVILMSAALNVDLFVDYFNNCPVFTIPGNLFDVQEYFLEDVLKWTKYSNKKMRAYMSNLVKVEKEQQHLNEWCSNRIQGITETVAAPRRTQKSPSPAVELGEDREELEPWLIKEMDDLMSDIWLNGNEDGFTQIFHVITSEGVSVDYSHSETTATPLMIASARGFTEALEQLLNMGANINKRASNGWTAVDWAKKFQQEDVIELLEAYMAAGEEGNLEGVSDAEVNARSTSLSQEDRDLLSVYQGCFDDDRVDIGLVITLVHKLHSTQSDGAILIFLPGYDDIVSIRDGINEDSRFEHTRYIVFTLHSAMQSTDQRRVFKTPPPGVRKIILATNIAETSLTINDVVYVINSGKVKERTYDALSSAVMLKSCWISKASAKQRKGRAGRCRPGVCYNMFSSIRYANMSEYQLPEIVRYPLQELCLQTKLLTSPDVSVADFLSKAPQAPALLVIRNAVQLLKQMDAFDAVEDLTELGHHLTDLPLDPQLGKMVLYSVVLKCLDPVLTITCALAYKDPFMLPSLPHQKRAANAARKRFAAGTFSDHMTYLRSFQAWQKARSDGWERSFCEKNFLSSATFEMIVGMRTQLLGQLRASGFVRARGGGDIRDLNTNSENWPVVKAALCAGSYPNLLRVDRSRSCLVTQKKDKVRVHNTSVLSMTATDTSMSTSGSLAKVVRSLPADWLIYEEMSQRERLAFVRCCTLVSPITVAVFGGPAKLPSETIREAEQHPQNGGGDCIENGSDSEGEERADVKKATLKLDDWIAFKVDSETMNMALHLRQKWHALFFRRMRAPAKPWSQIDEGVLRTVINVLLTEEQAIGLQQPTGIGQRPRPMSVESFQPSSGRGSFDYADYNSHYDNRGNSRTTRKSPATTPKRSTVNNYVNRGTPERSGGGNRPGSGNNSQRGSASSTPCPSPGPASPSQWAEKGSLHPARFFVMKCRNPQSLDACMNNGTWQVNTAIEKKISKAMNSGKTVYLIFSIQTSGHFQGYGKVISTGESDGSGKTLLVRVDWIKRGDLPFLATQHLHNRYCENRKVQVSRDGEEIEPTAGEALVNLWDSFVTHSPQHGHSSSPRTSSAQQFSSGKRDGKSSREYSNMGQRTSPNNAPLTILQRGQDASKTREHSTQQQAKVMPRSYPVSSPGAYQPVHLRQHYSQQQYNQY